jgi:hypothetical protein
MIKNIFLYNLTTDNFLKETSPSESSPRSYCSWIYIDLSIPCLSTLKSWWGVCDTILCDKVFCIWQAMGFLWVFHFPHQYRVRIMVFNATLTIFLLFRGGQFYCYCAVHLYVVIHFCDSMSSFRVEANMWRFFIICLYIYIFKIQLSIVGELGSH